MPPAWAAPKVITAVTMAANGRNARVVMGFLRQLIAGPRRVPTLRLVEWGHAGSNCKIDRSVPKINPPREAFGGEIFAKAAVLHHRAFGRRRLSPAARKNPLNRPSLAARRWRDGEVAE